VGKLSQFYRELSRRRVFRTVIAYVFVVWVLSQGAADLFPAFGLEDWTVRAFVLGAIALIPVVALLSWRFDITPEGVIADPFSDPGILAEEDLAPGNASEWAMNRHDASGAGYLSAIWNGPDGSPQRRQFFEPVVIGRDPGSDLQIADPRVSRVHALLYAEDKVWKLRDIHSSNGTFVNGKRVTRIDLPPDCRVRFHHEGPELELSVHKVERTAMTRDAGTREDLTRSGRSATSTPQAGSD
jgi:hypothetical protein